MVMSADAIVCSTIPHQRQKQRTDCLAQASLACHRQHGGTKQKGAHLANQQAQQHACLGQQRSTDANPTAVVVCRLSWRAVKPKIWLSICRE